MTTHTPITIRTAPETCIARTQRPSAERLLAGIFYIDVALDVGPTSSVLAHAAPSQSDRRCHRQRSLTPTVSRPHSRRMSRVRVPSLPTFEDHRKTNRLRQYERHPALAFLSGASPVQRSAGTPDRCRSTSALGSRSRHIPAEKGSNRINPKHAPRYRPGPHTLHAWHRAQAPWSGAQRRMSFVFIVSQRSSGPPLPSRRSRNHSDRTAR